MRDFYDGETEETKAKHAKLLPYIELAEKQGDAIIMEKAWEMRVILRKPKEIKDADSK